MKKPLKIGLSAIASVAVVAFGVHLYGHFAHAADGGEGHGHGHGEATATATADHAHDHGHGAGGGLSKLQLNNGQKWQTDAVLRQGMAKVRDHMAVAVPRIHAGQFDDAAYATLAADLVGAVTEVMKGCKLPPAADEQLHYVLAEIFVGTDQMKKPGDRHAGAVKVLQALAAYPKFFDDAEFKGLD